MTASSQDESWPRCGWGERCVGIPLGRDGHCVAHTQDQERRQSALADLRDGRRLDFTAGVPISQRLLAEILSFAPRSRSGGPLLRHADFSRATFEGWVDFRDASFEGAASFRSAMFRARAHFRWATFNDGVEFCWTEFQRRADFRAVRFRGRADFRCARFVRPLKPGTDIRTPTCVRFDGSFFVDEAVFDRVRFTHAVSFKGAWLLAGVRFMHAWFGASSFDRARLLGPIRFDAALFTERPSFQSSRYLGPMLDPVLQDQRPYVPQLFSEGEPYQWPEQVWGAADEVGRLIDDPAIAEAAQRRVYEAGGIDLEGPVAAEQEDGTRLRAPVPPTPVPPTPAPLTLVPPTPLPPRPTPEPSQPPAWQGLGDWFSRLWRVGEVGQATREAYEPGEAPGEFSQSTEAMRSSTRWIAAAFAGIGAVLVSGIGLSDIDYAGIGLWRSGIILTGVALALAGAGWMVYLGSRVLTLQYTTLGQLPPAGTSWRKIAPEFDGPPLPEPLTVSEIADRRDQVRREIDKLVIQQGEPDSDNRDESNRLNDYRDFGRHLQRLTEIAILYYNHRVTQRRYWRFNRWAFVAAVAVVLGVLMVVLAPTGYRRLDGPTAMDVVLTSEGVSTLSGQLGKACATGPLPAVGVGGSRREPRVVLLPPEDCRGQPHEETLTPALGLAVARPGQRPPQEASTPPPSLEARLRNSNTAGDPHLVFTYGRPGDELLVGDWDGDGRDSLGVWERGVFYLRNTNSSGGADLVFRFGQPGDVPIVGDWDGDGRDSVGVRRGTTFYLRNQNSTGRADVRPFKFGRPGGQVLVGDWEGIDRDSVGIRRGVNFRLLKRIDPGSRIEPKDIIEFQFGGPANIPFVGNWDADPEDEVGVRRGARFALRNELENGQADVRFEFGESTDLPLAGDWDDSGADSVGVASRRS